MGEGDLVEAMRAVQKAVPPIEAAPEPEPPSQPDQPSPPRDEHLAADTAFAPPEADPEPRIEPRPTDGGPVWNALRALQALLDLLPPGPNGQSRPAQCVAVMRANIEQERFPDALPDRPSPSTVRPITYPQAELNHAVETAKPMILELLNGVEIEKGLRDRLARELKKAAPFLETDDRGTVEGFIRARRREATGDTSNGWTLEKSRNDARLEALAVFLDALRQRPYAAVRCAVRMLATVAIPPDVLSVNEAASTVTFRGTAYPVPEISCCFVKLLIAANGRIVSSTDVAVAMGNGGPDNPRQIVPSRLLAKLPEGLRSAIETDLRGACLLVDKLLSDA